MLPHATLCCTSPNYFTTPLQHDPNSKYFTYVICTNPNHSPLITLEILKYHPPFGLIRKWLSWEEEKIGNLPNIQSLDGLNQFDADEKMMVSYSLYVRTLYTA